MTKQHNFMLKIKERIAVILLGGMTLGALMTSNTANAQDMQSSPLSRYGYGTLTDRSPVAWRGMGNVGIGMNGNKVINLKNPAAYAASDSLSFLLDLGASVNWGHYKDNANGKSAFLGGLDYVAMQFPVYKDRIAVSLGVMPFSRTGYGLSTSGQVTNGSSSSEVVQSYRGQGSLQSAYLGIGGRVIGSLALGANIHYLFGSLTHSYTSTPNNIYSGQEVTSFGIRMGNITADFGAQYTLHLKNKANDNLLFGVTYSPQVKIKPTFDYVKTHSPSPSSSNGANISRVEIDRTSLQPESALPHEVGAGFSWNRPDRYTVALDFSTALWSKIPNVFVKDGVDFLDTYNVGAGLEIKPDPYSRSYANRMSYRFGLNYGTSYLNLNKVGKMQSFGASVGFGMPVDLYSSDRKSMVNISLEYAHTMAQESKMFSEDILKLSFSLTFNETWFRKLKIY